MTHVLLVEDDPLIAKVIFYYLEQEEIYRITWARTGGEALAQARDQFDVILMDVLLPDVNGIDLCERLRQWHDCPILFLSCLDDSDTIVEALSRGGDDFLTKPFDNKVLAARIQANLRRCTASVADGPKNILECKGFQLDVNRHAVVRPDGEVKLSATEFRLLSFMMTHPGQHFTPRELYVRVWGASSAGDARTVLVHIHNLRKKIEKDSHNPRYIVMEWGKGYTFASDDQR